MRLLTFIILLVVGSILAYPTLPTFGEDSLDTTTANPREIDFMSPYDCEILKKPETTTEPMPTDSEKHYIFVQNDDPSNEEYPWSALARSILMPFGDLIPPKLYLVIFSIALSCAIVLYLYDILMEQEYPPDDDTFCYYA